MSHFYQFCTVSVSSINKRMTYAACNNVCLCGVCFIYNIYWVYCLHFNLYMFHDYSPFCLFTVCFFLFSFLLLLKVHCIDIVMVDIIYEILLKYIILNEKYQIFTIIFDSIRCWFFSELNWISTVEKNLDAFFSYWWVI